MSGPPIPFMDLRPGDDAADVRDAIDRVLASGWFVLGPELDAFESELATACGTACAVGVANGTDALALLLRAAGVRAGDEVIVPALTAAYTALAVVMIGAAPVFADVEADRLTMDPAACEAAISPRTRAVVPVHLYGQPADIDALHAIAVRHSLIFIEDCCQAHLATCQGAAVGTRGAGGALSFYPTKNLGALGDAGAVITNDPAIAARVRRLRNGGQTDRYHHVETGVNSRLDEMQAAVLRARLPRLAGCTERRRELARAYRRILPESVRPVPECDPGHVYHLFPVRSEGRDALQTHLRQAGVDTLIHYPVSLPAQPAFAAFRPRECPAAARAAADVVSLPLHPRLSVQDLGRIAEAVGSFRKGPLLQ